MGAPKKYSIQRIFDMVVKDVADTTVYGSATDMKEMSIENTQENVYSMGGENNPYIAAFQHSKRVTGTGTMTTFDEAITELITGTDTSVGAVVVPYFEDLEVSSDTATMSYTPVQNAAGDDVVKVEVLGASGVVAELTQDVTADATHFSYAAKVLTFNTSDYSDGTVVRVYYDITTGADAISTSNKADGKSAIVRLEFPSLVQDCDGNEFSAILIVYKAKLTGTWSFGTAADGDPATLDVSWEAMKKSCANTDFWTLVVYDSSAVS